LISDKEIRLRIIGAIIKVPRPLTSHPIVDAREIEKYVIGEAKTVSDGEDEIGEGV